MLFNSADFAVFLPLVFAAYWALRRRGIRAQNIFLVTASYTFYGWWDWRFLGLIAFSTSVDYLIGLAMARENRLALRKTLLWTSIVANLGLLGVFKYFNFFIENFQQAFTFLGSDFRPGSLAIVLPVGISFYTFQTLSYSIDVYRRKIEPTTDLVALAAFVSFFPQLVAGPIERAAHLLPQFQQERRFDRGSAVDGARQALWGLFKKVVIADNCAVYANLIFANYTDYSASTLLLGAVFFSFQIYGDFSGYSDIAIGISKLFGFDLMRNFAFPYFSRDMAEFWRRWHISLSTWFRDYLYIPLGGSRAGKAAAIRNTMIVFVVSGFWHGANWTFVVWGALNGLYFLPLLLSGRNRRHLDTVASGRCVPSLRETASIAATFGLTMLAWVVFRSPTIGDAAAYIGRLLSPTLLSVPVFPDRVHGLTVLLLVAAFVAVEWVGREDRFALQRVDRIRSAPARYAVYYTVALTTLFAGNFGENAFIYFQF